MQIRTAQKLAWENKVAKGFNTTDVPLEFCLLQGEIAEAFDAWHEGREDLVAASSAAVKRVTGSGVPPARSARSAAAVMFWSIPPNTTP
jgi:hypothetical protein